MSIEHYRILMGQLGSYFTIDEDRSSAQVTHLQAYGISFHAFYGGVLAPDHLMLHCDFGLLPQHLRTDIALRLLELNTYLFSIRASTFSYDEHNSHVVLVTRIDLRQLRLPDMLEILEDIAQMAQQWQCDYFLMPSATESDWRH